MSLTKNSRAFQVWAEQDRYGGGMADHSFELYKEEQYLAEQTAKERAKERQRPPSDDEQPEQKPKQQQR